MTGHTTTLTTVTILSLLTPFLLLLLTDMILPVAATADIPPIYPPHTDKYNTHAEAPFLTLQAPAQRKLTDAERASKIHCSGELLAGEIKKAKGQCGEQMRKNEKGWEEMDFWVSNGVQTAKCFLMGPGKQGKKPTFTFWSDIGQGDRRGTGILVMGKCNCHDGHLVKYRDVKTGARLACDDEGATRDNSCIA